MRIASLLIVGLLFVAACAPTLTPIDNVGVGPNDFTQNDIDGNPVSLSDFRGDVVIVEFWASWCSACRAHTPRLVSMWDSLQTKDVTMIGVSLDYNLDTWRAYVRANNKTWPNVADGNYWENVVARKFDIRSTPTFLIFDKNGDRVGTTFNFFELAPKVEELLAAVD